MDTNQRENETVILVNSRPFAVNLYLRRSALICGWFVISPLLPVGARKLARQDLGHR